jgi:hypothetical protein
MRHIKTLGSSTNCSFISKSFPVHPIFEGTHSIKQGEKFPTFIDPKVSLLCLQQPTTHLYPESYESSSHTCCIFQCPYQTHYLKCKEYACYSHCYQSAYFIFGAVINSECTNLLPCHTALCTAHTWVSNPLLCDVQR